MQSREKHSETKLEFILTVHGSSTGEFAHFLLGLKAQYFFALYVLSIVHIQEAFNMISFKIE